jgi:branched-chain amino acid transport system substrate-binding protein
MTTRRSFLNTTLAAILIAGLCGPALADEPPIRIGFSMSKTGYLAVAAPPQLNVYELWKEQINARGGMDVGGGKKRLVQFVEYDNQSKPEVSVRIYEKLITDDKVDLLLAPWGTPFHIAVAPVLEKYKFPMVGNTAASVAVRQVKAGYIWFPTSAIPDRIGVELVALMKSNHIKTVAILSNVLPFTKEIKTFLEPELKKAGIGLKLTVEYPPDITDMTSILIQVKKAKPDAVLALAYPGDSVLYGKQAKELGIDSPFQFVAIGPSAAFYRAALGTAAEGILTIGHWAPGRPEWHNAKSFFDAYLKRFKEEPDYLDSALAWTSLEILEQAVGKVGLDKEKLRAAIANGTFDTINGKVRFDGVQNAITPTAFLQIQKGSLQLIWPASIATSKFQPKTK